MLTNISHYVKLSTGYLLSYGTQIPPEKYTCLRDSIDHRDYKFSIRPSSTPSVVDLRENCSPIKDQGPLGSCTANALAGITEFGIRKAGGDPPPLSRLFLYYGERNIEGTMQSDAGAMLRDGVRTMASWGSCPEKIWPYVPTMFGIEPSVKSYEAAAKNKIKTYHRLTDKYDMISCLASGYPFAFGFVVYDSFETYQVATTGEVPMPGPSEQILGGHAVYAVGYDLTTDRVLVANSWGKNWGNKGYFTMPFAYLTDPNLAQDFWMIQI